MGWNLKESQARELERVKAANWDNAIKNQTINDIYAKAKQDSDAGWLQKLQGLFGAVTQQPQATAIPSSSLAEQAFNEQQFTDETQAAGAAIPNRQLPGFGEDGYTPTQEELQAYLAGQKAQR